MALARRALAVLLVLGIGLLAGPTLAQNATRDAAFTVSGVTADVTAGDAAEARAQALAEGQRAAFQRLVERLVPEVDQARVPMPGEAELTDLVQGFEIADERTAPDRYIATLTFRFKPRETGQFFRRLGVAYVESVSKPLVVVPVFRDGDGVILWQDDNPWRDAWAKLPSGDGLVPVVVPFGELSDLAIIDAAQALEGDRKRLAALAERYGAGEAVVIEAAVANDPTGAPEVEVTVYRYRPEGVRLGGGSYSGVVWDTLDSVLSLAAAATREQLEAEWRDANLLRFDRESVVLVKAPLESLGDWLDLRRRLDSLALVRATTIDALSPGYARLVLHYLGEPQQLATALSGEGLVLRREEDLWVLRRHDAAASGAAPETTTEATVEATSEESAADVDGTTLE